MTYDPVAFWEEHAPHLAGPGAASPEHERQEAALEPLLRGLWWRSVCEVGVGGGRIADLLHRMRPKSKYTGIDLGATQLDAGRRIWPDGEFVQSAIESYKPGDRTWDLVITSEVLMHVKPESIKRAVRNVLAMAGKHLVIVEWVPLPGELDNPVAPWNFPHDYRALLGEVTDETRTDRQVIYHVAK